MSFAEIPQPSKKAEIENRGLQISATLIEIEKERIANIEQAATAARDRLERLFNETIDFTLENPDPPTLNILAQVIQRYSPLPEDNFLARGKEVCSLTENQLDKIGKLLNRLGTLPDFVDEPLFEAYSQYLRYYLWLGEKLDTSSLPRMSQMPFKEAPYIGIPHELVLFYTRNLPTTENALRFAPDGEHPAMGGYVTPVNRELVDIFACQARETNPSALYPGKHPATSETAKRLADWFEAPITDNAPSPRTFFFKYASQGLALLAEMRRDSALEHYTSDELVMVAPPDRHEAIAKTGRLIGVPVVSEGMKLLPDYSLDYEAYKAYLETLLSEGKIPSAIFASVASEKGLVPNAALMKTIAAELFARFNVKIPPYIIADIAPFYLEILALNIQHKIALSPIHGADAVTWNLYQAGWGPDGNITTVADDTWMLDLRRLPPTATNNNLSDVSVTINAANFPVPLADILRRGWGEISAENAGLHHKATEMAENINTLGYEVPFHPETSAFLVKAPDDPTGRKTLSLFQGLIKDPETPDGVRIRLSYSLNALARTDEEFHNPIKPTDQIVVGKKRGDLEKKPYRAVDTPYLALLVTIRHHETPRTVEEMIERFAELRTVVDHFNIFSRVLNKDIPLVSDDGILESIS